MCRNQVCDAKSEPFYLAFTLVKTNVVQVPKIVEYSILVLNSNTQNLTRVKSNMWN